MGQEKKEFKPTMEERTGICRFCKQIQIIKVPFGWNEEQVNDEVTRFCKCDEAIAEAQIEQMINSAESQIKDFFKEKGMDLFKDTLLRVVEPMARYEMERISIKAGKYQISMKRKKSSIEVSIKVVTEEKVES